MRIERPGQARLSARQSLLLRGRFSFQDEVPGSSPGRPTTQRRRSQRCRQRAGNARRQPGPRWGRTPIPAGTSSGPSGAAHPGVRLGDDHPPWLRPSRGRQPRGRCRRLARPPAPVPTAQPPAAGASHAGLACLVAQRQARPLRPAPNPAARVHHRPPTDQRDVGSVAHVPASPTVVEPSTARQPQGLHPYLPYLWSRSPGQLDLGPNTTA
jgi:hypothetical protein